MSIKSFNEFEKRLYKTKSCGTEMSEDILAHRLLKSANLSNEDKQLIKAILPELQYESMKDQLKKTFSDSSWHNALIPAGFDNLQLTDSYQDNPPNITEYYPFREQQPVDLSRENNDDFQLCNGECNTFYNRNNYHPIINQANPYRTLHFSPTDSMFLNKTDRQSVPKQYPVRRKKNPCNCNGMKLQMLNL